MSEAGSRPGCIWVDADACPVPVREMLFRAATRAKVQVTLVANQWLRTPPSPFIRAIQVQGGYDVADDAIVERAAAGDLVVTQDIPLASRVLAKGAQAVNPRGDHPSQRARHHDVAGAGGGHPSVALAHEHPRLDQRAEELLDEEGIALSLLEDAASQVVGDIRDVQQVADQLLGLARCERWQGQLGEPVRVVALGVKTEIPGASLGIGARGDEDHQRQEVGQLRQHGHRLNRRWICPV